MLARIHEEMLESVAHLDYDTQCKVIMAYAEYQIYGKEPDPSDTFVYTMFKVKQRDLDIIIKDVQASIDNGKSGWRPPKTWDNSQKPKHNLSEPKHNLTEPEKEKEKEKEKDNENENKKQKYADFVFLTESEHTRLVNKFWLSKTQRLIDELNSYIGQIGVASASKRYKSHYFTILNWERREWGKTTTDYASEQALAKQRENVQKQIDEYLHSTESGDGENQTQTSDRRGQVLG